MQKENDKKTLVDTYDDLIESLVLVSILAKKLALKVMKMSLEEMEKQANG